MFEIGKEYRVRSLKDGMGSREGVLVEHDGPMFMLEVEGVRTIFHMTTVANVELVDREAEDARSKAAHAARIAAWS